MNILFVSALLPYPLYSGGQIRIYNLLKQLSKKHSITLCSFIRSEEEKQWIKKLSFCNRVYTAYRGRAWRPRYLLAASVGRYPFLFSTYANQEMAEIIGANIEKGDYHIVHLEPGYVWPSLPQISIPVPIVVAEHNIEHTVYEGYIKAFPIVPMRPILFADVIKLRFWENNIWKRVAHVVAVSDEDKREIAKHRPADTITVVPNGVDIESIKPSAKNKKDTGHSFLFVGNFAWLQNRDAVRWLIKDIWPEVRKRFPDATLRIVGRGLPGDLRQSFDDKTVLLEHVDDIRDEYAIADILLAPIRIGGGTKFKVLEAMAAGVPVVTTNEGASGLDVTDGEHLAISESENEFVRRSEEFITGKQYRSAVVKKARTLVEKKYSWETIADTLDSVWKSTHEKHR